MRDGPRYWLMMHFCGSASKSMVQVKEAKMKLEIYIVNIATQLNIKDRLFGFKEAQYADPIGHFY